MCGIFAILDLEKNAENQREKAIDLVKRLRHRGPDWSGIYQNSSAILAHERLSIVDVASGAQPLVDSQTGTILSVNGEIYNHQELKKQLQENYDFQTQSDCEIILYLYREHGTLFLNMLSGIFAFVLFDPANQFYLVARDPIGVIPLYVGWDKSGQFFVASELKALQGTCERVEEFPPGCTYDSRNKKFIKYYNPEWMQSAPLPSMEISPLHLRETLQTVIKKQLMCDVPYGVLLSGGLDSSIIASVATQFSQRRIESDDKEQAWWPRLHSFSVGLKNSPDLQAAQKVAQFIGTVHHEIVFTIQEGLDALSDVIYHLETFDPTTIRAGTPMYLMARKIKAMGIKMVLSGEGADEVFGGYLYFHKAPNDLEFHEESVRKIQQLHKYDCLRANKAMAAWGIEARVPFLDRDFLDVAMSINIAQKRCGHGKIEKNILREAFKGFLPDEILWRQKEQFSDGVGYAWIDSLKNHADLEITTDLMEKARFRFPEKTPKTKEAYLYRCIFEKHFPGKSASDLIPDQASVACSTETALRWDANFSQMIDPSGRAVLDIHSSAHPSGQKGSKD